MIKLARLLVSFAFLLIAYIAQGQKVSFEGFKKINGVNIFCKVVGEGTPILVIHGGPGMNMEYIEPNLQLLAKKHKLIFYDPRSTGKSAIPTDTTATKHQNLIDDIEGLRKAFAISKLNILAHSWGAKMAVYYALRYPANIKAIVLSNTVPLSHEYDSVQSVYMNSRAVAPELKEKRLEIMNRHITLIEIKQRLSFLYSMYSPDAIDKIVLTYPSNFADAQIALFNGLSADYKKYDTNIYPILNKITCPVLVLRGNADAIPLAADEKLVNSLGNGSLLRLNKSGHFPFIEEPDAFTQAVTDFFNKQK